MTIIALFLAVGVVLAAQSSLGQEVLLKEDFNGSGGVGGALLGNKNIELVKGAGPDGSNAIKVSYVGYSKGSQRVTGRFALSKKVTEATLSFDVMFEEDFQWVKGGKLHGLGPENGVTGGKARRADTWSARMMFQEQGKLGYYIYDQDPKKKWGLEKSGGRAFRAGKWHKVVYKVRLNDSGKRNGRVSVEVDGSRIISSKTIVYRGVDGEKTLISHFLFNTFHGGHDTSWAPKMKKGKGFTTVFAYYDNIKVTEGVD
ncbi:MAG: hypothetical protein ACI9E1_001020 [Cryomorphaceae bacterium]|jgi:hypothetical protein